MRPYARVMRVRAPARARMRARIGGEGVNTRPRCRILIGQQANFKKIANVGHRTEQVVGVGAMWCVDKV